MILPEPGLTTTPRTGVHLLDDTRLERLFLRYGRLCRAADQPPPLRRYACALLTEIATLLRLRGEGAA